jgi:hypothetical protein
LGDLNKKSANQNSSFANGNFETIFCSSFEEVFDLTLKKLTKNFVFELKLESESDYKNFIIFIPSRNSSLTCCQLRAIGDHHHVLKSSFVFSQISALTGNLSPVLIENVWSSGWELE